MLKCFYDDDFRQFLCDDSEMSNFMYLFIFERRSSFLINKSHKIIAWRFHQVRDRHPSKNLSD